METDSQSHISILQGLSDIKANLSVNTNETKNIKDAVSEIKADVKDLGNKVGIQNGRVRTLEDWAKEAQKVIESTTKIANETYANYRTDKTKIWSVIGILLFLGGTIITLSVMAINSKIKDGISEALAEYQIK